MAEDWEALLPELDLPAESPPAGTAAAEALSEAVEVATSGGAASSHEPAVIPQEVPVGVAVEAGRRSEERWLEGVKAKIEIWPGKYERVKVQCILHPKCEAQRAFSEAYGRETGCGVEEPFCCLGVWLRRAGDFGTAETHRKLKYNISVEERRAYAREHGWPLAEPVEPKRKRRRT